MILVTGATGTIGRHLIAELASKAPVRALSREPERARAIFSPEVTVVRGDFGDPASLASALDGIDALFLLSAPGPSVAEHDLAMLRAVKGSSVKKIVKLSAFGADASPVLRAGSWHQPGERAVMESGLAWTLLRPTAFMTNRLAWASSLRAGTPVEVATAHGRHAVIDPRDVAAAAAAALLTGAHEGRGYTLTGPEALSAPEELALIAEAIGRPVSIEGVTPDVAADRLAKVGVPAGFVDAVREGYGFVRSGRAAEVTDAIPQILGRPARSFATWLSENAARLT